MSCFVAGAQSAPPFLFPGVPSHSQSARQQLTTAPVLTVSKVNPQLPFSLQSHIFAPPAEKSRRTAFPSCDVNCDFHFSKQMLTQKVFPMALCLCVIRQSDAGSVLLLRPSLPVNNHYAFQNTLLPAALFSFREIIFILALKWNIFVRRLSGETRRRTRIQLVWRVTLKLS